MGIDLASGNAYQYDFTTKVFVHVSAPFPLIQIGTGKGRTWAIDYKWSIYSYSAMLKTFERKARRASGDPVFLFIKASA